jgi:4-aminobutyrate aminotransferase-like enzyme
MILQNQIKEATKTILPVMAFVVTGFLTTTWKRRIKTTIRRQQQQQNQRTITTNKQDVVNLRKKHFMNCVSVSYSNTGGLMIMRGEGTKLFDEQNVSYLDTRNNVCHVGHCHPKVVQAVQDQVSTLNTNTRYLHPNVCYLAQRLCDKCPDPLNVVVFVNSGSEANDLALRLARSYTKSKNTIVVDGGYHGHTLSVLEVSPYKYEHSKEFVLREQPNNSTYKTPARYIWKIPSPDTYRGPHRGNNAGSEYATYVKEACDYYTNINESVGAFIMEGGMSVG